MDMVEGVAGDGVDGKGTPVAGEGETMGAGDGGGNEVAACYGGDGEGDSAGVVGSRECMGCWLRRRAVWGGSVHTLVDGVGRLHGGTKEGWVDTVRLWDLADPRSTSGVEDGGWGMVGHNGGAMASSSRGRHDVDIHGRGWWERGWEGNGGRMGS